MRDDQGRDRLAEARRRSEELIHVAYALRLRSEQRLRASERLLEDWRTCPDGGAAETRPVAPEARD
jgi:hypothetical protein